MKLKKGILLILCLILLAAPAMRTPPAAYGEDGAVASIALTGGANKVIFSADSEIENRILYPDAQTDAQYLLPEGVAYDAASNTLSLTDFDGATANLVLTMMGGDFKIRLAGSSRLASVRSESMGRGGSISFCGDGALEIVSYSGSAIQVNADGAADFVRIEPQVRLTASAATGSVIRVSGTALGSGAISFDTTEPQVDTYDAAAPLMNEQTTEGTQIDVYTCAGESGLFGLAPAGIDPESESILYDVYRLGEKDSLSGAYSAELIEEGVADISAYALAYSPHDWTLVERASGATASRVRFSRFAVSAASSDDNGTISVSQTSVGRGGRVEVSTAPQPGYKLSRLTVNGAEVQTSDGGAIIDGVTSDLTILASFAESTPAHIALRAPAVTDFAVPGDGEADFVSEPFAVSVTDGADDPVAAGIVWTVEPQISGVSVGADGRVMVTSAAKSAAAEGLDFTLCAAAEGTELSAASGFTVRLSERRAAALHLLRSGEAAGEEDSITIPAAGASTAVTYSAVVFDQYGGAREEELLWSAGELPEGVSREGGTLTVAENCPEDSTLVLTASAASDSTVAASVTITFSAPASAPQSAPLLGAAPPEPVTAWPEITLAEDPVYGIGWGELVTLTGGTASVEGSFSVKAESALPNLSDSFRIVFTYADGEETKTVEESEAHAVTLSRKALDAAMVTLSPSSAPYTGAAITPAVSLKDGDRDLTPEVDFQVTGYADNTAIGTGSVTVEGLGNYSGTATKNFTITPISAGAVTSAVVSCKPEDEGTKPAITLSDGEKTLAEGTDYDLKLQYDIPSKTGTATVTLKGNYSGTRVFSFDLPNYLVTEGAGASWSKSSSEAMSFRANGALGKFTELTVDGKTVPTSYYSTESGSTIVKLKADYLKSLSAGRHIIGLAYADGKALAIFSVTDVARRGVATGDENNVLVWVALMGLSLAALGALAFALARKGKKKKKKRKKKAQ